MRRKPYLPKVKEVHIKVDGLFFENMFEPARRNAEKLFNKPISQREFTRQLFYSNIDLNVKLKNPNMDMRFAPRRKRFKL